MLRSELTTSSGLSGPEPTLVVCAAHGGSEPIAEVSILCCVCSWREKCCTGKTSCAVAQRENRFSDRGYVKGMVLLSAGVVVLSEVEQCRFMMASGADRLECHSRG